MLSDSGSAVCGDLKRNHNAQPKRLQITRGDAERQNRAIRWKFGMSTFGTSRCPFVSVPLWVEDVTVLKAMSTDLGPCSRPDIYSTATTPMARGNSTRAHLAEVIGIVGPPPLDLVRRGVRNSESSADDGKSPKARQQPQEQRQPSDTYSIRLLESRQIVTPRPESGEARVLPRGEEEARVPGRLYEGYDVLWRPEDRKSAEQLLDDPWLSNRNHVDPINAPGTSRLDTRLPRLKTGLTRVRPLLSPQGPHPAAATIQIA